MKAAISGEHVIETGSRPECPLQAQSGQGRYAVQRFQIPGRGGNSQGQTDVGRRTQFVLPSSLAASFCQELSWASMALR